MVGKNQKVVEGVGNRHHHRQVESAVGTTREGHLERSNTMLLLFHWVISMFRNLSPEYTHIPVQSHVYKGVHIHSMGPAFWFSIAAMTKYQT